MVTSPLCFHCMICFETFDAIERYPIVLPCGHTYVCASCVNRLERCMECRTSLFVVDPETTTKSTTSTTAPVPQPVRRGGNVSRTAFGRSILPSRQVRPTNPPVPKPRPKHRLPLPKNLVLLSLMEMSVAVGDMEKEAARHLITDYMASTFSSCSKEEDEEEVDIAVGTAIASGVCGTYVVCAKEGLEVLERLSACEESREVRSAAEGMQAAREIIRDYEMMSPLALSSSDASQSTESGCRNGLVGKKCESSEPADNSLMQVRYGERIQVVSINDGWAKLARRKGYVAASSLQLVKVGGPMDNACRVEGLLKSLFERGALLEKDRIQVERLKKGLLTELAKVLQEDDLTVLPRSPSFKMPFDESPKKTPHKSNDSTTPPKSPDTKRKQPVSPTSPRRKNAFELDFKTGLSGHFALLSSHAHPHEVRKTDTFRISDHCGLTIPKKSSRVPLGTASLRSIQSFPEQRDCENSQSLMNKIKDENMRNENQCNR